MTARILAYHRICDDPEPGLEEWAVSPGAFRRQMALLRRLGYRGVPVRELLDRIDAGQPADGLVALSFDDGYLDTVKIAAPILSEAGFGASVYIVPAHVGDRAAWDGSERGALLAGWDDLRKLVDAGWEIGMHTHSHPPRLDLLTGDTLEREVLDGLRDARERLGVAIDTFAYPHGHYSAATPAAVERAGYRAALSVEPGALNAAAPRFALPRYEIKRRDTLFEVWLMAAAGIPLRRRSTLSRLLPPFGRRAAVQRETPVPAITPARSPDREQDAA